mgnify:FL=1
MNNFKFIQYFYIVCQLKYIMKQLNRLKVVLVEKNKSGKWLAEQLGKDPATISRWCSNSIQPSIETMAQIAEILNIDVRELLNKSK